MKTDNIRIKRKNSDFLLFGTVYLVAVLIGIFLISLPFLSFAPEAFSTNAMLVALGVLLVAGGGTLFGLLIYRGIQPEDALIITNKGFTNRMLGGKDGVYVEWINVTSMKIFGLSKAPMLGLSLEDTEKYLSMLDAKQERIARANMEVGLPVIAIAQRDVYVPIGELKNLFSRMIKGAISWENYTAQAKRTAAQTSAAQEEAPKQTPPQTEFAPQPVKQEPVIKQEPVVKREPVVPAREPVRKASPVPNPASHFSSEPVKQEPKKTQTREVPSVSTGAQRVRPEQPKQTPSAATEDEIILLDMDNE